MTETELNEIEQRSWELVFHSRTDVPKLIAEVRRLREALLSAAGELNSNTPDLDAVYTRLTAALEKP